MKAHVFLSLAGFSLGMSFSSASGEDVRVFDIIKGQSPSGKSTYKGSLTVTKKGGDAVGLAWKISDGTSQRGIGFMDFEKKSLLAAFGGAEPFGVAVYEKKGREVGWEMDRGGEQGQSDWHRSAGGSGGRRGRV